MSYLLQKSNQNYKAGLDFCESDKNHCTAVHCAYYSCLQMMIHILITLSGKKEIDIYGSARNDGHSHLYFIREVSNLIEKRNRSLVMLYNKINDLKDFRVKSDYKNIQIAKTDSNRAMEMAQIIRDLLTNTFNLNK